MLGALDSAYEFTDRVLREAIDNQSSVELSDLWLPEMRGFRADRRFESLVQRLSLTDYWSRYGPPDCVRGWPGS
jgi:hypothetical protein